MWLLFNSKGDVWDLVLIWWKLQHYNWCNGNVMASDALGLTCEWLTLPFPHLSHALKGIECLTLKWNWKLTWAASWFSESPSSPWFRDRNTGSTSPARWEKRENYWVVTQSRGELRMYTVHACERCARLRVLDYGSANAVTKHFNSIYTHPWMKRLATYNPNEMKQQKEHSYSLIKTKQNLGTKIIVKHKKVQHGSKTKSHTSRFFFFVIFLLEYWMLSVSIYSLNVMATLKQGSSHALQVNFPMDKKKYQTSNLPQSSWKTILYWCIASKKGKKDWNKNTLNLILY